jgi:hypothetical protein
MASQLRAVRLLLFNAPREPTEEAATSPGAHKESGPPVARIGLALRVCETHRPHVLGEPEFVRCPGRVFSRT